ncbi:hypothetical protein MGYG_03589 [Nannizzia gypsea CBS 118893]|uniref:Uncharacterized protein n=1 Tax=Arthroderma gypseum (strain ATCC MYA-4604 / CBS 118893) TaxID=535722 RepID=E4USR9_ARTGP|nr:hypothetical protein MGYG_03589 [Nannizzia gypsea CBS 118893]EFR00584.1 hypothetical protein MGYG_03589 [Nannizzia gypsea CBS 118893]
MAAIYSFVQLLYYEVFKSAEEAERRDHISSTIKKAIYNSEFITDELRFFKREVENRYPHRKDIIAVVDCVRRCLQDEHGGIDPHCFFDKFRDTIYFAFVVDMAPPSQGGKAYREAARRWTTPAFVPSPRDAKTFCEVVRRWSDRAQIVKEFAFLNLHDQEGISVVQTGPKRQILLTFDTQLHAENTARGMERWMQTDRSPPVV